MSNKTHLIHPQYRSDIDGLRAIAVLSVLVFHAFPAVLPGGFVGVDVFFVISGYLISKILISSLERDRFNLIEFYVRRIRRIFPALILVLASCFAFGWFFLLAEPFAQLGKHIAGGAGFISNLLLWNETGYFDAAAETKPLLHLWSLGIEEQFYVVWPILLWLFYRWNIRLLWAALALGAVSFIANIFLHVSNPTADFYSPFTRFWELVCGGLLAYSRSSANLDSIRLKAVAHGSAWSDVTSCVGFLAICLGLAFISKAVLFPGYWAILPVLGAGLLIASGPSACINRYVLSQKPIVFVGLISFPLYLWHWPLLVFPRILKGDEPSVGIRVVALLLAFVLATLTYYLVERPLRFGKYSRAKTIGLLVGLLTIGFLGYNTYERDGLRFRRYHKENFKEEDVGLKKLFASYRYGACFIESSDARTSPFQTVSCDPKSDKDKRSIFLWGDSHAASLYPGLASAEKRGWFNLGQYNVAGCPPVLDFSNIKSDNHCARLNSLIFDRIIAVKPDVVILAAYWSRYNDKDNWNAIPDMALQITVEKLREAGVGEIVVIGNLPIFQSGQPLVSERAVASGTVRSYESFDPEAKVYDKKVAHLAANLRLRFFSPINALCNEDGCLVSLSKQKAEPLAVDYGHLTDPGSEFLVDKLIQDQSVDFQKLILK